MGEFVTVTVRQGALRGRRCATPAGSAFLSFQGVPYAKPPLGALRFKAPQPPEAWSDVRDATEPGSKCVQYDGMAKKIVGKEDCLFLNVFSPRLPDNDEKTNAKNEGKNVSNSDDDDEDNVDDNCDGNSDALAVLVFIHGGGFLADSSDRYLPDPFMDKDVVLVTINYRVGPLGFLGLNTSGAPGNAGLKDQTMALRWVKDNIAVFGGDPNNITIFGESAGGTSVHFHLLSPLSKGLFQRAIVQSGSALLARNVAADPAGRAKRLARAAGCDAATLEDPARLLYWLREVSPQVLVQAVEASKTEEEVRAGALIVFVPCVEPPLPDAFLPADPETLLRSGDVSPVPVIFGITSHEGMLNLPGATAVLGLFPPPLGVEENPAMLEELKATTLKELASDLQRLLPRDLVAKSDPQHLEELVARVKAFYFGGKELSDDTLAGLVNIYTDVNFALAVLRSVREHARLGSPVFLYEFAFRGRLNLYGRLLGDKVQGACHADELGYQFAMPGLPEPEEGSPEAMVRQHMGRLWTNFAKTGNPTPSLDETIIAAWSPFSETAPNYLRISESLAVYTGLLKERMQFWANLYSL